MTARQRKHPFLKWTNITVLRPEKTVEIIDFWVFAKMLLCATSKFPSIPYWKAFLAIKDVSVR